MMTKTNNCYTLSSGLNELTHCLIMNDSLPLGNHYLNQWWQRLIMPYFVLRSQRQLIVICLWISTIKSSIYISAWHLSHIPFPHNLLLLLLLLFVLLPLLLSLCLCLLYSGHTSIYSLSQFIFHLLSALPGVCKQWDAEGGIYWLVFFLSASNLWPILTHRGLVTPYGDI